MASNRSWEAYPAEYRAREMQILANWILSGESGSVVGLDGSGRSNLLGFLCHRPEVLRKCLPPRARSVALIPVDLNDLPARDASTLYRVILRSFDRVRDCFEPGLQQAAVDLYRETRGQQDPFLSQSALQELLLRFQAQQVQVALVLNHFDRFYENASQPMLNSLRGLRDAFKDTLCYIVGMGQEVAYLANRSALGDMYELLDSNLCWVGPLSDGDARWMIDKMTYFTPIPPTEAEITAMLSLAGNFPALIKAIVNWWLTKEKRPPIGEWEDALLAERTIQYRLACMWDGLTQQEQLVLASVQKIVDGAGEQKAMADRKRKDEFRDLAQEDSHTLERLEDKGLSIRTDLGWRVYGDLLSKHVAVVGDQALGRVWMDEDEHIYQGRKHLAIQGIPKAILVFFIKHPKLEHSHDTIIDNVWPPEDDRHWVSKEALQQNITQLRKKIEHSYGNHRYIVTVRGGYIFWPDGRPVTKPSVTEAYSALPQE